MSGHQGDQEQTPGRVCGLVVHASAVGFELSVSCRYC